MTPEHATMVNGWTRHRTPGGGEIERRNVAWRAAGLQPPSSPVGRIDEILYVGNTPVEPAFRGEDIDPGAQGPDRPLSPLAVSRRDPSSQPNRVKSRSEP